MLQWQALLPIMAAPKDPGTEEDGAVSFDQLLALLAALQAAGLEVIKTEHLCQT